MLRREWCERLGLQRNNKENDNKDLRICARHDLEEIRKPYTARFPNGGKQTFSVTFLAPKQTAPNNFRNALPNWG